MTPAPRSRAGARRAVNRRPADAAVPGTVRPVLAAVAAYCALRVAATYFSDGAARLWGVDFPLWQRDAPDVAAALLVPFLALLPAVRTRLGRLLAPRERRSPPGARALALAIAAASAATALAWSLQTAFAFLGDGSYYATEIYRIVRVADYRSALVKPTAFLAGHAIRLLALWLRPENVRIPFAVVGAAGMAALAGGTFALVRRERRDAGVLLGAMALLSSAALMFFGYVELYALEYACAALFLVASARAFRGGGAATPAVLLVLAVACGASALVFVPAYLFLLHWRVRGTGGSLSPRAAAGALAALAVAAVAGAYAVFGAGADNPWLLPLVPALRTSGATVQGVERYTALCGAHLADVANAVALDGGALAVAAAALALARFRDVRWSEPPVLFALLAALGGALLLLFGNAALGLGRDWDLATVPALGIAFLGAALLLDRFDAQRAAAVAVLPVLALALASQTYLWIRLNLAEEPSARRLAALVVADRDLVLPIDTYTGWENLRKYARSAGDEAGVLRALRAMRATGVQKLDTYDKLQTALATAAPADGRAEEFRRLFAAYAEEFRHPAPANAVTYADPVLLRECASKGVLLAVQAGAADAAREGFDTLRRVLPAWKEAPAVEAFLLPDLPATDVAARVRAGVDSTTRDPALLIAAAQAMERAAEDAAAAAYYRWALARAPGAYPHAYLRLARILVERFGRRADAIDVLRACVDRAPGTPDAADASRILDALQRMP